MGLFKKSPQQLYDKAISVMHKGNYAEGVELLKKAAEGNFGLAWYELGNCYYEGHGVERDECQVVICYQNTLGCEITEKQRADAWEALGFTHHHSDCADIKDIYKALFYYEQAAAFGHVDTMLEMGHIHSRATDGVIFDTQEALRWYRMAAEHGNQTAMACIGNMYARGKGVEKDEALAEEWIQKALDGLKGIVPSSELPYDLKNATLWLMARDCPENFTESNLYDAIQQEFLYKEYALCCKLYEIGSDMYGIDLDKTNCSGSTVPYHASLEQLDIQNGKAVCDSAEKYLSLAEGLRKGGYEKTAFLYYQKAADLGLPKAIHSLADCYRFGDGVETDEQKALSLYKKAAEMGSSTAVTVLGLFWRNGAYGMKQDAALAEEYLIRGASSLASAARFLGEMYEKGIGVDVDLAKAVTWYEKAEEMGDARSSYNLAWIYRSKEEKYSDYNDYNKMIEHYEKAAALRHVFSCLELGNLYLYSEEDKNNYDKAEQLLTTAARLGNKDSFTSLADLYSLDRCKKTDGPKAFYWFKKGAEAGNGHAQFTLGKHYQKIGETMYHKERARTWLEKAKEQGYQ